jgi:hypothetical protein
MVTLKKIMAIIIIFSQAFIFHNTTTMLTMPENKPEHKLYTSNGRENSNNYKYGKENITNIQ